jgi:predicted PurR-regulated permease PerM
MNSPAEISNRAVSARRRARGLRALAPPLWILAGCALIAGLKLGREALVPVALAILLALVLSSIVELLRRYHIPRGLSALVLLVLLAAGGAAVVDMTLTPAQQWMQSAPRVLRTIERKLRPAQSMVRRLDDLAKRASALAGPGDPSAAVATTDATAADPVSATALLAGTGVALVSVVTVMALTLLLLAGGPPMLARMTAALARDLPPYHALRIIDAIRLEVGRYYGTLALINVCFGAVTATAMWLLGMPNPILWGAIAGVLNFIPYLGSATSLAILSLVALVTFDSISHVLLVGATYLALATIEGHIVEPVFLGRRLDLNPIVVLVALWVGGWLWGIPGVVVALPALVAAKVAAAHSERGDMLARFLSPTAREPVEIPPVVRARSLLRRRRLGDATRGE